MKRSSDIDFLAGVGTVLAGTVLLYLYFQCLLHRTLPGVFWLTALILAFTYFRHRNRFWLGATTILALGWLFVPVDISVRDLPGPPRLARVAMIHPSGASLEKAKAIIQRAKNKGLYVIDCRGALEPDWIVVW